MKYSIIIPVYNVYKYIDKCLKSIEEQTYEKYEVIIVNDGSPDKSQSIIDKYAKKNKKFRSFIKENGGISSARNYGIARAKGEYLIFLDSDDYLEKDYLEKVNDLLKKEKDIDVVKVMFNIVDEKGKLIRKEIGLEEGYTDFVELTKLEFIEPSCGYVYKRKFWEENKFIFLTGKIHEDFGLTPEVLMKSKKTYFLNYHGYNYVQRECSIMSSNDEAKLIKKAYDMLSHYDRLISIKYKKDDKTQKYYNSFLANAVIGKEKTLTGEAKKKYHKELKNRKVTKNLLSDTIIRKIKKLKLMIEYL